jgi:C3HC zinc finger-like
MLKCDSCQAALVVKIHPKITKKSTVTKLIQAYQKKLATAHKQTCPFRMEAELYLLPTETKKTSTRLEPMNNLVPAHFASVLPRDVWDMIEQADPNPLILKRFDVLADLLVKDRNKPRDGAPPPWQFPKLNLPKDVIEFAGGDSDANASNEQPQKQQQPKRQSSLQNRILAKLSSNRKKHDVDAGVEHETLLLRVDAILHPRTEEEENRVQTRAQSAWESLYEGIAALTLFGWMPTMAGRATVGQGVEAANDDQVIKAGSTVSLHCPICLSSLHFKLQPYDVHHLSAAREHGVDEQGSPPNKRRRLDEKQALNPLMAHRYHCPYICGFPKDGERKGTPIWVSIASKLFSQKDDDKKHNADESDMDHLLHLLQSGVASSRGGQNIKNSALAC